MFYTGKGDKGKTKLFDSEAEVSKSSAISDALGALDEVNSFLGLCKTEARNSKFEFRGKELGEIVHGIQNDLFTVQAELAGADKSIREEKVKSVEKTIDEIEKELPPIETFFIAGGTELAARFDVARTHARRAERRVVAVCENTDRKLSEPTLAYLNRLSSVLYALARLSNHKSGITEVSPDYK
jgi:cob(I)alamin adenosyltransferase